MLMTNPGVAHADPRATARPDPTGPTEPTEPGDEQRALYEHIVASLIDYVFGEGETAIADQLRDGAADLPATVGRIAFTLTQEAAQQAEGTPEGELIDLDLLLGVVTEMIDNLLQLAAALRLLPDADNETVRTDALAAAVEAYLTVAQPSPEEVEAAQALLAQMQGGGEVEAAAQTLQSLGSARGEDPFREPAPPSAGLMGG